MHTNFDQRTVSTGVIVPASQAPESPPSASKEDAQTALLQTSSIYSFGHDDIVGLSSQYIRGSSLVGGLNSMRFRVERQLQRPTSAEADDDTKPIERTHSNASGTASPQKSQELLELDALNMHPCMLTLLRTLDFMEENFGSGWPTLETAAAASGAAAIKLMPAWMQAMHRRMSDTEASTNARLLICKVILNRPTLFRPFSNTWLLPLLELVLKVERPHGVERGLHYFLRDVCCLITEQWSECKPQDGFVKEVCKQFINHLLAVAHDDQANVTQYNLTLIGQLLAQWNDVIDTVDLSVVMRLIRTSKSEPLLERQKRCYTALNIMGLLLVNDKSVWSEEAAHNTPGAARSKRVVPAVSICNALIQTLQTRAGPRKTMLCESAAEVCGLLLCRYGKLLERFALPGQKVTKAVTVASVAIEELTDRVYKTVRSWVTGSGPVTRDKTSPIHYFLHTVFRISSRFPLFLTEYIVSQVSVLLPTLHTMPSKYLQVGLRIVQTVLTLPASSELPRTAFNGFKSAMAHGLNDGDRETQLLALQLVRQGVQKGWFTHHEISSLLLRPTALKALPTLFANHEHIPCRQVLYETLMLLWDHMGTDASEDADIAVLLRALLHGFADKVEDIRSALYSFWDNPTRMPKCPRSRFQYLLATFFDPKMEEQWLQSSSYLLLELSRKHAGFGERLFDNDLQDSLRFSHMNVNGRWRSGSVLAPQFASIALSDALSQSASQSMDPNDMLHEGGGSLRESQARYLGMVRATQTQSGASQSQMDGDMASYAPFARRDSLFGHVSDGTLLRYGGMSYTGMMSQVSLFLSICVYIICYMCRKNGRSMSE